MKRNTVLFFIVIAFTNLTMSSQISSGLAKYTIKFNDKESFFGDIKYKSAYADLLTGLNKKSKNVKFILEFNQKESLFYVEESLNIDYGILVTSNSNGLFYNDSKSRLQQVDSNFGGLYLIESNLIKKTGWRLKKEYKMINGYKCFKAENFIKVGGSSFSKIVAWYCPEIPFRFGPVGINNLPGLIFELTITDSFEKTFLLSELKLSENTIKITKPNKGKKVTKSEYNEIGKKIVKELRGY